MDIGESIKFRVTGEIFEEASPVGGQSSDKASHSSSSASTTEANKTPYRIFGAINESGLGLLSWWAQDNANAEEGDEDDGQEDENTWGKVILFIYIILLQLVIFLFKHISRDFFHNI